MKKKNKKDKNKRQMEWKMNKKKKEKRKKKKMEIFFSNCLDELKRYDKSIYEFLFGEVSIFFKYDCLPRKIFERCVCESSAKVPKRQN